MNEQAERHATFNSPLETGVRALAVLAAAHPDLLDLQRLVEMDYLVVHSGDAGGPQSLHAPLPLRAGELLVRRGLIENGLYLMMSRGLVRRVPTANGFAYVATEAAAPFLASLTSRYMGRLRERAGWVTKRFEGVSTDDITRITHRFFERWSSQFQPKEGGGASP